MEMVGWSPGLRLEDRDWLLDDAKRCQSDEEKILAVNSLMHIWWDNEKPADLLDHIRGVAPANPVIEQVVNEWLAPPSQLARELDQQHKELRARQTAEQAAADQSWLDFIASLGADPGQLRRLRPPTEEGADSRLFYLWSLLRSADPGRARYAIDDVSPLEPIIGSALTAATRDALIAFWRQWTPLLESSREPEKRNTISSIDCMGITGVSLEARFIPNWTAKLNSREAMLAAVYATLELNGFPSWLPGLAKTWPTEILDVLMREICAELDDLSPGPRYGTLQDVASGSAEIAKLVTPALLGELQRRPALPSGPLSSVLDIITRGQTGDEFLAVALERLEKTADPAAAALYLGASYKVDADAATKALIKKLKSLNGAQQSSFVQRVLPALFGDRLLRRGVDPKTLPFQALKQLVIIAFRAIRVGDDRQRQSGKAYSPDERDDAEWARSALFNELFSRNGRATFDALRRWASVKGFGIPAERLHQLSLERAAMDSEHSPWQANDAYEFERTFDTSPQTPSDLQAVLMRRVAPQPTSK
jgi:hypothetical protein